MSELRVDSVKSKGGGAPDLPKGVTISGITTAATLGATTVDVSNVNVSGVVTSATLNGELLSTGTPTLGLGVTINSSGLVISGVATAGIVSATTLYGDGTNITGIGASIAPLFYNPDPNDSLVLVGTGLGITFNSQVKAGTGDISIRIAGAAGTVVENFGVGSSVTISENKISFTPTAGLTTNTVYHLNYPSGCFTNNEGTDYVGTAYTFHIKPQYFQLWTQGSNGQGQLGLNTKDDNRSSPTQVPGSNWRFAANTATLNVATRRDGSLWTMGNNGYGQLGHNSRENRSSPTQIPGTWSDNISGGGEYTMFAVNSDGELFAWGDNTEGQLGLNDRTRYSSPVQIPGTTWSTTAEKVWSGKHVTCAVKTDGTLWTWGANSGGQLGLSGSGEKSSPCQVPGTTWNQCAGSGWVSFATRTDGTMWCWGYNERGELGLNEQGTPGSYLKNSPVQMGGTGWKKVTSSKSSNLIAYAINTSGELFAWGYNNSGCMGVPSLALNTRYSSPTQIPGTTWDDIIAPGPTAIATKTDGTLWGWGHGGHGRFGLNEGEPNYSSPVQLPGTNWTSIGGGDSSTLFTKTD